MAAALDQQEYCKICQESFPNWEAFLLHKIQSKKHISCLFCGQDFKTTDGCSRHQHQVWKLHLKHQQGKSETNFRKYHAAEQNLKCAGCGLAFIRVGSYISHIEQNQCPVIHKSLFDARRTEREKAIKEKKTGRLPAYAPTDSSTFGNDSLAFEDNGPTQTSWDMWGEDDHVDFPALPLQDFKNVGSKVPDLLTGQPDKLNQENLAWHSQKELFPYLPDKPTDSPKKPLAAVVMNPSILKEEFHPFDPDSPEFNFRQYYNPFTEKYRCPWPGCK
jgi:hypothetical protein